MTKFDLIREVSIDTGVPKIHCEKIIDAFIEEIRQTLITGDSVELTGLGVFYTKKIPPRNGYDINNGGTIALPESTKLQCRFSRVLKDEVKRFNN